MSLKTRNYVESIHNAIRHFKLFPTVALLLLPRISGSAGLIYQTDYSDATGWTQVNTGVSITNDELEGFGADGNSVTERSVHRDIGSGLIPDDKWKCDFDYKYSAENNPAHYITVLSSISTNPSNNTGDSIAVIHGTSNGQISSIYVHGGTLGGGTAGTVISISANTQYYIRIERVSTTSIKLSIFSDKARTTHIAGSPQTQTITSTTVSLRYLWHTNAVGGASSRTLTGVIDNLYLYTGFLQNLSEADAFTDSVVKAIVKAVSDNDAFTDTTLESKIKAVSDTDAFTDTTTHPTTISVSDSVAFTDAVEVKKVKENLVSITDILSSVDTITRKAVIKTILENPTFTDSVKNSIRRYVTVSESATFTDTVAVKHTVYKKLTVRYDLLNTVNKTDTIKYDLLNTVNKTDTILYDILNQVPKPITIMYDILSQVTKTITVKYDILGAVAKILTAKYDLLNSIAKKITIKYSLDSLYKVAIRGNTHIVRTLSSNSHIVRTKSIISHIVRVLS